MSSPTVIPAARVQTVRESGALKGCKVQRLPDGSLIVTPPPEPTDEFGTDTP